MEEQERELNLINMEDIESKTVEWLWYPYIPFGKITIVQGDPGEGKTTFALRLAAILSRGDKLPCADMESMPIDIIYQTAEDGLEDTIKPRLVEAEADCSKINVIDESKYPLSMGDERLREALMESGARLIILDPIQAYLGADVDMHRANEIRPVMKKLSELADEYNCAIILIGHMNKSQGSKSTYRGLGSIDFQAAARSVLIVGRIKEKPQVRVIAHDKSSLAPEGVSVAFELDKEEGFKWIGEYDISSSDLLSGKDKNNKLELAKKLLMDELENGDVPQKIVLEKALAIGISKRTLNQAKKELDVESVRENNHWVWRIS